jgi:hypothetical protein
MVIAYFQALGNLDIFINDSLPDLCMPADLNIFKDDGIFNPGITVYPAVRPYY